MAQEHGERFTEYLKRVMLHAAPLTGPADVAWFLASYARDAKARLEGKDRPAFFSQFDEGHAVQYFYEPFLKAFDPELRKDLAVWFTPPEIVQYMVARVDTVLREELSIADGLADPRVYVLDPCCGTGAYLVEVLRHIHGTLTANRDDALVAHDLKNAARDRVFGFEILPAPFVVAHLQLGLLLANLGAPLAEETAAKEGALDVEMGSEKGT